MLAPRKTKANDESRLRKLKKIQRQDKLADMIVQKLSVKYQNRIPRDFLISRVRSFMKSGKFNEGSLVALEKECADKFGRGASGQGGGNGASYKLPLSSSSEGGGSPAVHAPRGGAQQRQHLPGLSGGAPAPSVGADSSVSVEDAVVANGWALVSRLDAARAEEERKEEEKKKEACKLKLHQSLRAQVSEKQAVRERQKQQEKEHHVKWKEKLARQEERVKMEEMKVVAKGRHEARVRRQQAAESVKRKQAERAEVQAYEAQLLARMRGDIQQAEEVERRRKEEEKERLKAFLLQNEVVKAEREQRQQQEQEEDIRLMKEYTRREEEKQRAREESLRKTYARQEQRQAAFESNALAQDRARSREERVRLDAYQRRMDEQQRATEQQRVAKAQQRTQEQMTTLQRQVEERRRVRERERAEEKDTQRRMQRQLLEAKEKEEEKDRMQRERRRQYKMELDTQRQATVRGGAYEMSVEERRFNGRLVAQMMSSPDVLCAVKSTPALGLSRRS